MKNKPLGWIVKNSGFMLFPLVILVASSMTVSLCSVVFALFSQEVIDCAVNLGLGKEFLTAASKLTFVIVFEIALRVLNSRMNVSLGAKLEMRFRENAFSSVLRKKWSSIESRHSGDVINRIKNDSAVITSGVIRIIPSGVMLITRVVASFIVLCGIDASFALIMCACGPFVLFFGRLYSKQMKKFHKAVQQSEGRAMSYMLEAVQNLIVVKAFGIEDASVNEASQIQRETVKLRIQRNNWSIFANVSLIILFTGGYAAAILWGAYKLSLGLLTFGGFTAMVQLVNDVQTPFRSMGSLFVSYQNMLASAERIIELEDLPDDEISEKPDIEKLYRDMESIVLDNVSFSYGGEDVLKNASCEIKKGEFVALSGISGSGKSTIMRLLLSLIEPSEGKLYIKGKDDTPITASLRPLFGYVPQGNMLISGSIAKNIAFYSDASDEDVSSAARRAKIGSVISALPEGINSVLGEKGSGLSEGQIQRIAIARALARRAPVLLLDEATSALDEATEIELLRELRREEGITVIIITHRTRVFDYCDRIINLKDGSLREV